MKTFFSVLVSYILLCLVGVALTSSLIMIYMGCIRFVVGQPLNLFSLAALKAGFEISLPLVMIFIPMFLVLSLIRHSKKNRFIGIVTSAVLIGASWIIGMPLILKSFNVNDNIEKIKTERLSAGYFRLSDNALYYFTNVDSEFRAEGIVIDLGKIAKENSSFKVIENEVVTIEEAGYFSDILVKRVIEIPPLLRQSLMDLYNIGIAAKKAADTSFLSWLFFCTFIMALIFVFALADASRWRLISAFFVVIGTGLVLKANAICYGISYYKTFIPFLPQVDEKLSSAGSLAVVINCALAVLFVIIGLAGKIRHGSRKTGDDE